MSQRSQIRAVYVRPLPLEVVKRITRRNALDPRLEPTDRHMQRWAISLSGGITVPSLSQLKSSARAGMEPLAPQTAATTDSVVASSPDHWRAFVELWYCTAKPSEVIAKEIGVERTALFIERRLVLAYLLGSLTRSGVRIASYRFR